MKCALLFPGQGSQYLGMGQEFWKLGGNCARIIEQAEEVCQAPLRRLAFEGPLEELTRAAVLQPAVTAVNLMCLQAFRERLPGFDAVHCFAGHSLGEYSALAAAGVIAQGDALRLVERRGFFMEREGDRYPGSMRAVLGLEIGEVEAAVAGYQGPGTVVVANHNTAQQVVLSGSDEGLEPVCGTLEEAGAKVIPLKVSVANHSPLVARAVPDFSRFMAEIDFGEPRRPVYFNVSADVETNPEIIKDMMARQIASRVRWFEIISKMLADGVDTFIEAGPGKVLRSMMKKIVPKGTKVTALQFDTPDSLDSCLRKMGLG